MAKLGKPGVSRHTEAQTEAMGNVKNGTARSQRKKVNFGRRGTVASAEEGTVGAMDTRAQQQDTYVKPKRPLVSGAETGKLEWEVAA